jgi:hypothetical protein
MLRAGEAVWQQQAPVAAPLYRVQWQAVRAASAATPAASGAAQQPLLAAQFDRGRWAGVLPCPAAASSSSSGGGSRTTEAASRLLQALQSSGVAGARAWLLHGGALCSGTLSLLGSPAAACVAAALHAVLKVAAAEQLTSPGAAVLLSSGCAAGPPSAALGDSYSAGAFGTALDGGTLFSPLLLPDSIPAGTPGPTAAEGSAAAAGGGSLDDGCVPAAALLTGGLGGLGLLTAAWLAARQGGSSGRRLVLLGRSGRVAGGSGASLAPLLAGKESVAACQVSATCCDVAAAADVAGVVESEAVAHAVHAVLHAGSVLVDASLPRQSAGSFRAAAAPKLSGLSALSAATAQQPVRALLLFSSIAGLLGSAGQANYAAANAALDAAAQALQQRGCAGVSLQWGPWTGAGMAAAQPQLLARLQRQGYGALTPPEGLTALQTVLGCTPTTQAAAVTAARFDWSRFLAAGERQRQPFYGAVRQLQPLQQKQPSFASSASHALARAQAEGSLPPAAAVVSAEAVLPVLLQLLAEVAGGTGSDAAVSLAPSLADTPFLESGLDSIGAVELR